MNTSGVLHYRKNWQFHLNMPLTRHNLSGTLIKTLNLDNFKIGRIYFVNGTNNSDIDTELILH